MKPNIDLCNEFLCQLKAWCEQRTEDAEGLKKTGVTEVEDLLDNIQGIYDGKEVKCLCSAYLEDMNDADLEYIFKTNDFSTFDPMALSQICFL